MHKYVFSFPAIRLFPIVLAAIVLTGCSQSTAPDDGNSVYPDAPGLIYTWAGTGEPGWDGDGNSLLKSKFYWPVDLTITPAGKIYILDWNNHRIRYVTKEMTLQTLIGTDFVGDGPYDESDLTPPGAPGTMVNLNHPTHLLPTLDGTLILTAWHNHKLRSYDPITGLVVVICGAGAGFSGDGGPARDALLNQPSQTILAPEDDLLSLNKSQLHGGYLILDQRNQRVRQFTPNGIITTVVGTGEAGFAGDGGPPLEAKLQFPSGTNPPPAGALALDSQNRLYISDTGNNRIRRVDFQLNTIETIAGNGHAAFSGDGGAAIEASVNNPRDIAFGPDGLLYVADELNHRVRAIDLTTGIITTVAGNGIADFAGDNGPATQASLYRPAGLEFDNEGHLYIVDTYNHRIRRINL